MATNGIRENVVIGSATSSSYRGQDHDRSTEEFHRVFRRFDISLSKKIEKMKTWRQEFIRKLTVSNEIIHPLR